MRTARRPSRHARGRIQAPRTTPTSRPVSVTPSSSRTGTSVVGPPSTRTRPPTTAAAANVEDGAEHLLRLIWNPGHQVLDVHFDGEERLLYPQELSAAIFGGVSAVTWGFTGASGGFNNFQYFCETAPCAGAGADAAHAARRGRVRDARDLRPRNGGSRRQRGRFAPRHGRCACRPRIRPTSTPLSRTPTVCADRPGPLVSGLLFRRG